jgi:protein phosphatase
MTRFHAEEATDTGRVRDNNQDLALVIGDQSLFAVADGMGGHNGGETAAKVAIETLRDSFMAPTLEALVEAMQIANEAVVTTASTDPELTGMGTTLCVLAGVNHFGEEVIGVASVGDSRAYLIEGGRLHQITRDHTLVQMLVDQGQLSPVEAESHPQRNILTRALGIDEKVMVDSFLLRPVLGDRYLLCSDGLFGEVTDDQIHDVLRRFASPGEAARELVQLANASGGHDNITCVVVDVVEGFDGVAEGADRLISSETGQHRLIAGLQTSPDVAVPSVPLGADAVPEGGDGDAVPSQPGDGDQDAPVDSPSAPAATPAVDDSTPGPTAAGPPPTLASASLVDEPAPRRFTWRSAVFVVFVLVALALAFGATAFYARNTYFVGLDDGRVAIFRGRPGGVLWFNPTVAQSTTLELGRLPPNLQREVEHGKDEPNLADAQRYVRMLEDKAGVEDEVPAVEDPPQVTGRGTPRTLPVPDTAPGGTGAAPTAGPTE